MLDTVSPTPRYAPTYRRNELTLICNAVKEGHSLCFVGIAGTGKSNITNFLHHDPYGYKPQYFDRETATIHFPVIDGNTWDQTPEGLWKLMLAALAETTEHLDEPKPDPKIAHIYADQRAYSELKTQVKWLCQEQGRRVMFILDDFDMVLRIGPLAMLEQLNALRNDGNRGMFSYLIFTKRLPHVLGRDHPLQGTSKFYDLFSQSIYALGLYNDEDARQMLQYLNESAGRPLRNQDLPTILTLCGGHARLLKVVFELWRSDPPSGGDYVTHFLAKQDVRNECRRILNGLHEEEQAVAMRLANGQEPPEDQPVRDHLIRRGLVENVGEWKWFSPLFVGYLRMERGGINYG